jgi:hypothetical protein
MTRTRWIGLAILASITLIGGIYKLRLTPEWTVLTGTVAERQVICRSVYKKSASRAAWALERLFGDEAGEVRVTAIEALARRPDLHAQFASKIEGLAEGGDLSVRGRALEYIFKHPEMLSATWLARSSALLKGDDFRSQHPELLSFYLAAELDRRQTTVLTWMLELLAANALGDTRPWETVLRYSDQLRGFRKPLIRCLEGADDEHKSFATAVLMAASGGVSGGEEPVQEALDRFTVEMEWANRIHPNFHVDVHEGERCLHLGEGAGGYAVWRSNKYHTVDVGQAQLTFTLAKSGDYQIWCRSWFSDKCGNHALLYVDDTWFKGDSWYHADGTDQLRTWHWKRLESRIHLAEGRHTLTVKAADDGLFHDKLALLPAGKTFNEDKLPPINALYDPAVPCSVSITPEAQSQSRGTTQTVTAWVRRNQADILAGKVRLMIPPPFRIVGEDSVDIVFGEDSPLASADFRVELPAGSSSGELRAEASFVVAGQTVATGTLILGMNYDWYTTGPLSPGDPLCVALRAKTQLTRDELKTGWSAYPHIGYDRYRRLNFEQAYGQARDAYIFLYTEIEITKAGSYQSFLTIDDMGYVFVGGERVGGRNSPGVGEGNMLVDSCELKPGRYPVFAWIYQSGSHESPSGRGAPNHWAFKWLLRETQHRPSPDVRSVPVEKE